MNNKIKKSLSYFSLFILALGMLPLGNILADEKVEPTKFVIEQNNLEANGFKIANDQVLTGEDVVKLSNVKSVDNLVDVNSLTVSDDQLANVNQVNPDGGLYNLTLTNGQQAIITIPVIKEGSLVTTNSKGALIFKNLALSQEATTKEKVLEETGAYSVAFNNGYVNSDLTVDIKENNTIVKDTNLGLNKELTKSGEVTPRSGGGKAVTLPNTMESIMNDGKNGNVQAAIAKGKENLEATMASARTIQVHNEREFIQALNPGRDQNIVIDVVQSFDVTDNHDINGQDGTTFTITSSNGSHIRLAADDAYECFTVNSPNVTVNFTNITFIGMINEGEAIQIGMNNPDLPGQARRSMDLICDNSGSSQTSLTINTYPGFVMKDVYEGGDAWSGAFLATWTGQRPILNMYGGEFSNINGQNIVSANFRDDVAPGTYYLLNVYDVDVHDTYTRVGGVFGQEYDNRSNVDANFFGGRIYDNVNGSRDSRGAIVPMAEFNSAFNQILQSGGYTTRIGADFKVYDNYVVNPTTGAKLQQANISVTARDYSRQLDLANTQLLINPQPNSKIYLGNNGIGQGGNRNIDNAWDSVIAQPHTLVNSTGYL